MTWGSIKEICRPVIQIQSEKILILAAIKQNKTKKTFFLIFFFLNLFLLSYELNPGLPGLPLQNDCCLPLWKQPRRCGGWGRGWCRDSSLQGVWATGRQWKRLSFWSRERGVHCRVCQRLQWRLSRGGWHPQTLALEPPGQLRHQHWWRGCRHPPPYSAGEAEPGYVSGWKVRVSTP